MRALLRCTLALSVVASAASAQDSSATPRPNLVVVDGLAGVWLVHTKQGDAPAEDTTIVGSASGASETSHPLRIGYHRALDSLTVGGGVHYGTFSGNLSQLVLAPRVGAWFGGGGLAVWPRAGLTYGRTSADFGAAGSTTSGLMVAAELLFVAPLAPHVGLSFGPGVELGVSGSHTTKGANGRSEDYKSRVINAQLGFVADF